MLTYPCPLGFSHSPMVRFLPIGRRRWHLGGLAPGPPIPCRVVARNERAPPEKATCGGLAVPKVTNPGEQVVEMSDLSGQFEYYQ